MSVSHASQEICMREDDYMVICGCIQILDMSDFSTAHVLQMTPTVIKKMTVFAEDAAPIRLKAIHIINTPKGFDKVFNVLKPLMPVKQQERVGFYSHLFRFCLNIILLLHFQMFVHASNYKTLYDHIPQKYLPQELGGENGSIESISKEQMEHFSNHHAYFLEDHIYRVEENLRRDKIVNYDEIFGIEGSFRKLNVD